MSVQPSGSGGWLVRHRPVPLRPSLELSVKHLELHAPSRLTMREEDATSTFDVEYRLQTTSSGGTRFTQVSDFEWKKLPPVLHKTFERGVRRDIRGQLRALKKVLEDA